MTEDIKERVAEFINPYISIPVTIEKMATAVSLIKELSLREEKLVVTLKDYITKWAYCQCGSGSEAGFILRDTTIKATLKELGLEE